MHCPKQDWRGGGGGVMSTIVPCKSLEEEYNLYLQAKKIPTNLYTEACKAEAKPKKKRWD